MKALIAIGPPAEAEVRTYLRHETPDVRHRTCQVLGKIGSSESLDELQQLVARENNPLYRGAAEDAVKAIKDRGGKPPGS
jgi:HEAT repeat protein